jgi:hypothetical protein
MAISKNNISIILIGIRVLIGIGVLIGIAVLIYFITRPKPVPEVKSDDTKQSDPNSGNPDSSIQIEAQPSSTIQIINNTGEEYLHVFLQFNNVQQPKDQWKYVSGKGVIYNPVNWGLEGGKFSWNPLGAKLAGEAIIPKNEYIILSLPDSPPAFVIMGIKMKTDDNKPLVLEDGKQRCGNTICKVIDQASILIEGGKDMVSDSSAVDGINFKIKYELTTNNGVEISEIYENIYYL